VSRASKTYAEALGGVESFCMPEFSPVFTPFTVLLGGSMIGLAAVLLLCNGRIAGISGLLGQTMQRVGWRNGAACFVVGVLLGPAVHVAFGAAVVPSRAAFPSWALLLGGLLVGYGTALAHGCTSGHGVCGLARRSTRSLLAVLVLVATAMLTRYGVHHVWPLLP
jgi:uncharacterized membrane protein YedE/YeeE